MRIVGRVCLLFPLVLASSECLADLQWIEVDGVRVVEPPAEHPRLYLRARDLPKLRDRLGHPVLKPAWEELQAAAHKSPQVRGELGALRYLIDREIESGRQTVALVLSLVQQARLTDGPQNKSRRIGRLMVTGAIVYDWCYPLLTSSQKTAFITEIRRLAEALECGYPPNRGSSVIGHPSEWMILRDLLSAGIATYDESPEMYRLAARRFFGSHVPARNWWYPGHAFHQGPGYADARFVADMYALWIFDRLGAGNVFNPSQQFVPYDWIYTRRPDNRFIRSGDGQNWPTRLGSLLAASYYADGYVLANYLKDAEADPKNPLFQFLWPEPGQDSPAVADTKLFEVLWRDPDLKPLPLSDLPLSRFFGFPYGAMVARTGWDEQSVIAQLKINVYNFTGHQHNDAGGFDIYHKGPLAVHSGIYQGIEGGYGSPHHVNYYKRTVAHNSLLIYDPDEKFTTVGGRKLANDGGQRLPNNWREINTLEDLLKNGCKTGTVLGQGFGPDPKTPLYTYLKGDITEAYSTKVREVKRSFVFLNLGHASVPAALVVFDRVVSAVPSFRKTWLLHSIEEPVIDGMTTVATLNGNGWSGRLFNTTLLPGAENVRLIKVGGPGKEFWVDGRNYPNDTTPSDPERAPWRVELSPIRPASSDLFLNALQVTDRDVARPLPVERIESPDIVGIHLADRVVLFNPRGDRTTQPVRFTVSGEGTLKCLVTDLAEGTWQVWRDQGIALPAVTVSGDAGLLYFEGPAGSYALRR